MTILDKETQTLLDPASFNSEFIRELVTFADKALGPKTKRIFRIIASELMNFSEDITLTWLAMQLKKRHSIPLSTAKWYIRKLLNIGLISGCRGKHPRLTKLGLILYLCWRDELEEAL